MINDAGIEARELLARFGVNPAEGGTLQSFSPVDDSLIGALREDGASEVAATVERSHRAFLAWREIPPPRRGELVRLFGEELRQAKSMLGRLVTLENGKILQEGLGEVQEMIDICEFAVGLSRQLYGLTIASERPRHKMLESWHPLGPVGVISAFNFPVAVFAWNAALALVCGDSVIWKPSEKTPFVALATASLFDRALEKFGADAPHDLLQIIYGGAATGEALVNHPQVALLSATGSTAMGRKVGPAVAARFGRSLLELGGNAAMIVTPHANLDLAIPAILFGAVGTAGQRCTTLRRVIVHDSIADRLIAKLKQAYRGIRIGDPREASTLMGPLIDALAREMMQNALRQAEREGGTITGGAPQDQPGIYVQPAIVEMPFLDRNRPSEIVRHETFAPILYILRYSEFAEALRLHNDVPQALSSCIFTDNVNEAEMFISAIGSDCGIANVNLGPSGAEIGGAFGGEKETGGGRESGSDAWKTYMRRQTITINFSGEIKLAQGISFGTGSANA